MSKVFCCMGSPTVSPVPLVCSIGPCNAAVAMWPWMETVQHLGAIAGIVGTAGEDVDRDDDEAVRSEAREQRRELRRLHVDAGSEDDGRVQEPVCAQRLRAEDCVALAGADVLVGGG